ncbi:MAG: type II toxin-antitoxin system HicA family toxin [Ignavibacteriales bacterium]|nr:type II toxin-antitoxin system HicA family toxin [Ignavibacteriales bacterium]
MPKLPRLSGKELIRIIEKIGFKIVRIKGSHYILKHEDGRKTVIPVHSKEIIGPGLITKILKDCEIQKDELIKLL